MDDDKTKKLDTQHPEYDKIFDELPELTKASFYVGPVANDLTEEELAEYKGAIMDIPARHRARNSIRNLAEQYARCVVALRRMQKEVNQQGLTVVGSQGQLNRHPLLPTISNYQGTLQQLTQKLQIGLSEDRRSTRTQSEKDKQTAAALKTAQDSGSLLATPSAPWKN
ncbi:MAG: P27 family phage terminase small subunit [Tateyamaria sp.]|uniref:P27 family phage terminase small subunit n=1 Tax=Tateyamaria sp. TaxID=1929288 RepID=UPI00329DE198